jgi:hypothetical protein
MTENEQKKGIPRLTTAEAEDAVKRLTYPRVTKESIEAKVAVVDYIEAGITTICTITMVNGFKVIGHSTPAHPGNYIRAIGERYAFDNAFRQLWSLEGYLLREKLYTKT